MANAEMKKIPPDKLREMKNFARVIEDIRELTQPGCSDAQLRSITAHLRNFREGAFFEFWRLAGFDYTPKIPARNFDKNAKKISPNLLAVCFSGEELHGAPTYPLGSITAVNSETGERQEIMGNSLSMEIWEHDKPDFDDMLYSPFYDYDFKFGEYFSSTVAYYAGQEISRENVIEYSGYFLGNIHARPNKKKKNVKAFYVLDKFFNEKQRFARDDICAFLLGISHDIINSPDIRKYVQKISEL